MSKLYYSLALVLSHSEKTSKNNFARVLRVRSDQLSCRDSRMVVHQLVKLFPQLSMCCAAHWSNGTKTVISSCRRGSASGSCECHTCNQSR
eukprot:COSAG01_NODE_2125_length_8369_cov_17.028174_7_plen_91_part_00